MDFRTEKGFLQPPQARAEKAENRRRPESGLFPGVFGW